VSHYDEIANSLRPLLEPARATGSGALLDLGLDYLGLKLPDLFQRRTRVESSEQLTLSLDVPSGAEAEVARLLRLLADELVGP
jgi:hypothetical protein